MRHAQFIRQRLVAVLVVADHYLQTIFSLELPQKITQGVR